MNHNERITKYNKTSIPGIEAKTTLNKKHTCMSGYLVYADSKEPIDRIDKIRKKIAIKFDAEIPSKRTILVGRLVKQYRKKNRSNQSNESQKKGFFTAVYEKITDKTLISGNWSPSTMNSTHIYFEKNVLPRLDQYGPDITMNDMDQIVNELLVKTNANGKSFQDQTTTNNFYTRLDRINQILQLMSALRNEIPLIQFPVPTTKTKAKHREQIKYLPRSCLVSLVRLLFVQVYDIALALACGLMFFGGLRTGEAAGVLFGEVKVSSDGRYATLFVCHRLDDGGKRITILKSESAYRLVVLPYPFVVLYQIRTNHLLTQGYSQEEIDQMTISGLVGQTPSTLSDYVKNLLLEAGLTNRQLQGTIELMQQQPDIVDSEKERDICAYILRRDWVGRAANCGMSSVALDYYIGHRNDRVDPSAYLDEAKSLDTAHLMDRCVYLPECSLHPVFCPIGLKGNEQVTVPDVSSLVLRSDAEKSTKFRVIIKSLEPGDTLQISTPRKPARQRSQATDDPVEDRQRRPILGVFDIFEERKCYRP